MSTHIPAATRQQCYVLHDQGHSYTSIAKQLNISYGSAKRHAQRNGRTEDLPRSGRPKVTSPATRKLVKRKARAGYSTVRIAAHLSAKKGVEISRQTVGRVVKGGRKPLRWGPVVRVKVLRSYNKPKRVAFCRAHVRVNWKRIVFVDSKYLYVARDPAKGLLMKWQEKEVQEVFPEHSNPRVFHFYAAIAHGHKSKLVFVPPTRGALGTDPRTKVNFTSEHFVEAMIDLMDEVDGWFPPGVKYKVVLDHASLHASKASKAALKLMEAPIMEGFPSQAWDLNAIQVTWSWMMQHIRGHNPRTPDGWMRLIKKAWDQVPISSINKLVCRMPKQVHEIIEAEGQWVKYFV